MNEIISPKSKRWLCLGAWLVAGIATVIPDPGITPLAILFAWMFPFGVFRLVFSPDTDFGGFDLIILIGGWLIYGYLTVLALSQNRRARFVFVYAILCVLLVLTAAGCNKMLHDPIKDSL